MTTLTEPPPSGLGRSHRCLPPVDTSFVGRSGDLAALAELLASERLVTLTGPPGVGKTRLALELAHTHARDYPDGAAFVDLVPVRDPAHLPGRLASQIGVREVAGASVTDALIGDLAQRRLLLVLDNCEHLLCECAEFVARLLDAAPALTVLTTSREPLDIPAEAAWAVPPLAAPAYEVEPPLDTLLDYPAVRLFVERARSVQRNFALVPHVAGAVTEIARRLDGLPLALELAAAGVENLTPAEIASRLNHRSRPRSAGGDGAVARHRTLQTALDWSHDLLPMTERVLLARLSVFTGKFCLEDAEGVCSREGLPSGQIGVLLGRLVAKSLVVSGPEAEPRYSLLETIRVYAGERLEQAGEVCSLRDRHANYYLALAERAETELAGPRQEQWFERLESEHANLRAALDWSLGHAETERALRLAGALVLFWRIRCYFSEGRESLREVLAAGADGPASLRAKALWGEGFMAIMAGDIEGALAPLEQSLELFRQLGDKQGIARALLILADQRQCARGAVGVLGLLEQSAALAREVGDHWCLAHALGVAGFEYERRGDFVAARPKLEECLRVARQAGDKQGLRYGLIGLGSVALGQGDYEVAEDMLSEAVAISQTLGEDQAVSEALFQLAKLALARGRYERARSLANDARAVLPAVAQSRMAASLIVLGRAAHAEGDLYKARDYYEQAVALADGLIIAKVYLADLLVSEGDTARARQLLEGICDWARASGHEGFLARALYGLGELPRRNDDAARASILHLEALEIRIQLGAKPEIISSLEAVAALAIAGDRLHLGVRLLSAARAHRDRHGYTGMLVDPDHGPAALSLARSKLPASEFAAAYAEGQAMSFDQALALARRRRPRRARAASGWTSLTSRERDVAALVAESLTNTQIAGALHLSPATVKTHLLRMYGKLGISSRRELAREVRRHEHVSEAAG